MRCRISNRHCINHHSWFVKDNQYYIGDGHDIPGIPLDEYLRIKNDNKII
jgi:hypothetical protein